MCGIAGVVGLKDSRADVAAVKKMTAVLARRGPDDEGVSAWDGAVLGHRRLAIFDLSAAGHQPMLTPDGAVGVVFNGAIYNFHELRDELTASGYKFVSQTDTEVLLHGYMNWGIDRLVGRLRGMFAFGLWDDRTRKLYLVRDRLGVKPLVYAVRGSIIAFASTTRALASAGFANELDEDSVREFMIAGFLADDRSIYKGVRKVAAASILEWSEAGLGIRTYWNPPSVAEQAVHISFRDALEQTKAMLLEAVRIRLNADVPVAALLSGGIDSTLVCWAVKKLGGDITAFTVGTPGDSWDETAEASETARRLDLKHCVVEVAPPDPTEVGELVSAYAEPFGSASALGMLGVSRAVASSGSAKVLLTGDGGDDVFLGYSRHRNFWIAGNFGRFLPDGATNWGEAAGQAISTVSPLRRAGALLLYGAGGLAAMVRYSREDDVREADHLLGQRYGARPRNPEAPHLPTSGHTLLDDFLKYEFRTRFVGEYMTKVDGGTMRYGIEARSPFLDHKLWEFAAALPYGIRLHGGRLKSILRQLVRDEISNDIARRPKRGFGIPVQRWIVGRWRPAIEEMFRNSVLEDERWIRPGSALARLGAAQENGTAPVQLWYLVVLESWLRHERSLVVNRQAIA